MCRLLDKLKSVEERLINDTIIAKIVLILGFIWIFILTRVILFDMMVL